jgi:dUTPase
MFKTIKGGKLPTRGTKHSACVDLYANADVTIGAGETVLIPLGVCIDLGMLRSSYFGDSGVVFDTHQVTMDTLWENFKNSHYLQLMLHNKLSEKKLIANTKMVNLDYKDEIMMRAHKPFNNKFDEEMNENCTGAIKVNQKTEIKKGDRVAQITLLEHKSYLFGIESDEERTSGFGSTSD